MNIDTIKKDYFNFEGRINRKVYLKRFLILFGVSFMLGLILGVLGLSSYYSGSILGMVISLIGIFATFSQHIKRLHDLGKNAWWSLIMFIPIANLGILIYMFFFKGDEFTNKYGPDPLANDIYI